MYPNDCKNEASNLRTFTLSNGVVLPSTGFGTWKVAGVSTADIVLEALNAGYRLIDTAAMYKNEAEIGEALAQTSIAREDLRITSKCPPEARHYDDVIAACNQSLHDLGLDYLDLYLVHWPACEHEFGKDWISLNRETWSAMIDLYKAGKVRAIGVSNFLVHHLEPLMDMEVTPMVNQIEYHPGYLQPEVTKYCQAHNIVVQAWSPLGRQRVLKLEELEEIAKKTGKSTAQICLRFELQNGILPLPKSAHFERMKANLDVFDFELDEQTIQAIDSLPETGFSGHDPDTNQYHPAP